MMNTIPTTKPRVLLVVVLVLIASGALFVWFVQKNNDTTDNATTTAQVKGPDLETSQANESPRTTETAQLKAINNYIASGTATRTVSVEFIHTVTAILEDPADGKFYEGWLVNAPNFISTGKLTKETDNTWSLTYASSKAMRDYPEVVITEETSENGLDNKPEVHVLEGSF